MIHSVPPDALNSAYASEIEWHGQVRFGDRGSDVKRVQEWLVLHGAQLAIDGIFGSQTGAALQAAFQVDTVDAGVFARLSAPMRDLARRTARIRGDFEATLRAYIQLHLEAGAREVGGQNRGPWVRLYMDGREGAQWPWCAGFVSFLINQAAEQSGRIPPIKGSVSCDVLAAQAQMAGIFHRPRVDERSLIPSGSVFLIRRVAGDWVHTGFVTRANRSRFYTVEGNTNDEGSREGYEVCARTRRFDGVDFIVFNKKGRDPEVAA